MKTPHRLVLPAVAGLAVGAALLLAPGGGSTSAAGLTRPDVSRPAMTAQVDVGRLAPLAGLTSYKYTLEVKATGAEARYMNESYTELGDLPVTDHFAMSAQGVVVGPNAQTTLSIAANKGVMWLNGDRFELKVNGDAVEKWAGPFETGEFDDTSLYAAQQYWDDALLPWFEANRNGFACSITSPLGMEVRDCAFDTSNEAALYDLLDAVSYGSFDEYTRMEVKASFLATMSAPYSLTIVAHGADELGGDTSLELTMSISDMNNAALKLPAAPSGLLSNR